MKLNTLTLFMLFVPSLCLGTETTIDGGELPEVTVTAPALNTAQQPVINVAPVVADTTNITMPQNTVNNDANTYPNMLPEITVTAPKPINTSPKIGFDVKPVVADTSNIGTSINTAQPVTPLSAPTTGFDVKPVVADTTNITIPKTTVNNDADIYPNMLPEITVTAPILKPGDPCHPESIPANATESVYVANGVNPDSGITRVKCVATACAIGYMVHSGECVPLPSVAPLSAPVQGLTIPDGTVDIKKFNPQLHTADNTPGTVPGGDDDTTVTTPDNDTNVTPTVPTTPGDDVTPTTPTAPTVPTTVSPKNVNITINQNSTCASGMVMYNGACVLRAVRDAEIQASRIALQTSRINTLETELNTMAGQFETSVWRDTDGNFNTARLASDSIAAVVLGTTGGVVTSTVMKKKQVESGFEEIQCTIGGQVVAT